MAEKKHGQYHASFVYTEEVLNDFEAMYRHKKDVSPKALLVMALLGVAGVAFFVIITVVKGFVPFNLVYAALGAAILLAALVLARKKKRPDPSVERYRKHYLNKKANFQFEDGLLEMKLHGQKAFARSKYKDVYALYETEKTLFLEIKGRAYYILPKDELEGGPLEDFKDYLQHKTGRKFQYFAL